MKPCAACTPDWSRPRKEPGDDTESIVEQALASSRSRAGGSLPKERRFTWVSKSQSSPIYILATNGRAARRATV